MNKFQYFTSEPKDLLSIEIKGERIKLVTISSNHEEDMFQEFTDKITIYMFPNPVKDIGKSRKFITESREAIAAGYNLQFVILSKATSEFLGCVGLHGEKNVRTPEIGIWLKKRSSASAGKMDAGKYRS